MSTKPFEPSPGQESSPLEGVRIRINPKNKFLVFELHYSADPTKRAEAYRDSLKSSMPLSNYLQEYELQWDTFVGTPVYRDFQERVHVSPVSLEPEEGLPLLMGWDFGLTPACIIAQLQGNQMVVLREFQEFNMGTRRFAQQVIPQLRLQFQAWNDWKEDWVCFADPAGARREDSSEATSFKLLHDEFGLTLRPGAIDWESRKQSVEHFLLQADRRGPGLLIDPSCVHFIRGMGGGYRYPERVAEVEPAKIRPIKDEFSHIQDAFQMICSAILQHTKKKHRTIKTPGYAFGGAPITPTVQHPERAQKWR